VTCLFSTPALNEKIDSTTKLSVREGTFNRVVSLLKTLPSHMVEMALKVFLFVVIWLLISPTVETAKCSAMPKRPLVMAHRGSSGVLPENTIEAFERAISDGADVLECDVTLSMDLVPVCLHEELLQVSTDVASRAEFRDRYGSVTVIVDGNTVR